MFTLYEFALPANTQVNTWYTVVFGWAATINTSASSGPPLSDAWMLTLLASFRCRIMSAPVTPGTSIRIE